jgi:cyclomaltodextrinase
MKIFAFRLLTLIFLISSSLVAQKNFPEWASGIVWYQIFPERFADGDSTNDPEAEKVFINSRSIPLNWSVTRWTSDWFSPAEWEKQSGGSLRHHLNERRYGGDVQGIIDHLDYLKDLGIGGIYLNPVFEAVSLHKYDGSTYHHIDVNFGPDPEGDRKIIKSEIPDDPSTWKWTEADKLFLKLIREVHNRGMRIIIDGVFNHTGIQFWAFKDIVKNGQNSRYKDWYEVKSFDDPSTPQNEFDYRGWWNSRSLPQFNRTENDLAAGPKQYIFNATGRWMDPDNDGDTSDGIDGWRLDVARDVPLGFWRDWSKLVKSINPNSIVVGELWELSPDFISEHGVFDALMNYNFAFAVNKFFVAEKTKIPVSDFIDRLKEVDKNYPDKNLYILQNLVDSHDTERISSMIANPDREYDRDGNERNPDYNPGKPSAADYEKQKLIAAFQMTYRGAPMIYYGDEAGMWGADDPHDRKPMVWGSLKYDDEVITTASGFHKGFGSYNVEQNKDLLDFYGKLISIHNNNEALKRGDLQFVYSNDDKSTFAFKRTLENETLIIAFNTGVQPDGFSVALNSSKTDFTELLSGKAGTTCSTDSLNNDELQIKIPPGECLIYKISP